MSERLDLDKTITKYFEKSKNEKDSLEYCQIALWLLELRDYRRMAKDNAKIRW